MTVHHKDLCPCGSGKRYKHCHLPLDQARVRRGRLVAGAAVLVLAGAVGAWTLARTGNPPARSAAGTRAPAANGDSARTAGPLPAPAPAGAFGLARPAPVGVVANPVPAATTVPLPAPSNGALAPGENPAPWEYDVEHDRHFDPRPEHRHWHQGPPPAGLASGLEAPAAGTGGPITITGKDGTPFQVATPLASGEHPAPWEYDAARNRYFDPSPGHNHWHPGKPPANAARTPPPPVPSGSSK